MHAIKISLKNHCQDIWNNLKGLSLGTTLPPFLFFVPEHTHKEPFLIHLFIAIWHKNISKLRTSNPHNKQTFFLPDTTYIMLNNIQLNNNIISIQAKKGFLHGKRENFLIKAYRQQLAQYIFMFTLLFCFNINFGVARVSNYK